MGDFLKGTGFQPYSMTYMRAMLQEHFETRILITQINGKRNGVTFRVTAQQQQFFMNSMNSNREMIQMARLAELLKQLQN